MSVANSVTKYRQRMLNLVNSSMNISQELHSASEYLSLKSINDQNLKLHKLIEFEN